MKNKRNFEQISILIFLGIACLLLIYFGFCMYKLMSLGFEAVELYEESQNSFPYEATLIYCFDKLTVQEKADLINKINLQIQKQAENIKELEKEIKK